MNHQRQTQHFATLIILLATMIVVAPAAADYFTPGTGVDWTLADLVDASAGSVTGGGDAYQVHESVIILALDRVTIAPGTTVTFVDTGGTIGLEVNGSLVAVGTAGETIVLTGATATPGSWRGLDYRDPGTGSEFHLAHCEIAYADEAVDVFGADVQLEFCEIHHSLSKALDISSADGLASGCHFHDNQQRTITMTLTSSPTIENCLFENNNLENSSPYPYFNVGLQGVNSPTIRGNTVHGSGNHMSGGIAIWNASGALIEGNTIEGCGYGILCYQTGANPTIVNNDFTDNNIHPDTVNWGFGIACNGVNSPIVAANRISGHWYGVAAINGGQPNLGDLVNDFPGDDGDNKIWDNGLEQVYGFYNNTPLPQMAQGNWWGADTQAGVEDAIYHQNDDPSLGLVNYDFWLEVSAAGDHPPTARVIESVTAYPNPFNPQVAIDLVLNRDSQASVMVVDVAGRLLRQLHNGPLKEGVHGFDWDGTDRQGRSLPSGVYFYRVVTGSESQAGKLMLVR